MKFLNVRCCWSCATATHDVLVLVYYCIDCGISVTFVSSEFVRKSWDFFSDYQLSKDCFETWKFLIIFERRFFEYFCPWSQLPAHQLERGSKTQSTRLVKYSWLHIDLSSILTANGVRQESTLCLWAEASLVGSEARTSSRNVHLLPTYYYGTYMRKVEFVRSYTSLGCSKHEQIRMRWTSYLRTLWSRQCKLNLARTVAVIGKSRSRNDFLRPWTVRVAHHSAI
jgi:hypothetical protein